MSIADTLVLCILVYMGFPTPQTYMNPWLSWIRWINLIYYAFRALARNEGTGNSFICSVVSAAAGQSTVSGDDFINQSNDSTYTWENYGILFVFFVFFHITYFTATGFNKGDVSKAEALEFRPGHGPKLLHDVDEAGPMKTH
ncbi:ABC multidrug transporter [Seiridium cupressi]